MARPCKVCMVQAWSIDCVITVRMGAPISIAGRDHCSETIFNRLHTCSCCRLAGPRPRPQARHHRHHCYPAPGHSTQPMARQGRSRPRCCRPTMDVCRNRTAKVRPMRPIGPTPATHNPSGRYVSVSTPGGLSAQSAVPASPFCV